MAQSFTSMMCSVSSLPTTASREQMSRPPNISDTFQKVVLCKINAIFYPFLVHVCRFSQYCAAVVVVDQWPNILPIMGLDLCLCFLWSSHISSRNIIYTAIINNEISSVPFKVFWCVPKHCIQGGIYDYKIPCQSKVYICPGLEPLLWQSGQWLSSNFHWQMAAYSHSSGCTW